jgi:hypothetical protein
MKQLLLFISLLFLLGACQTTKYNTRETSKSTIEVKNDIKEEVKILEETKVSDYITQWTDELTTVTEHTVTVKLSAPDSLNNQYPAEITTTAREYVKGKTIKSDASSQTEKNVESNMQKTDNSTQNIKAETLVVDKTTVKKTTPTWVIVATGILSVGILIFVYLTLKKYRIL